ncbi:Hypothetical predicted protein [Marmota monax]|uniref:Uncharacterized protein n=1 Tax=Marmota monax TaxID=9995 RepID=A0A5E4AB67_MARMO|nr:hypothetical protein GHT09_004152 [Marmota monax]VTJ53871.1 Hypothetical predicted protein [Marmota monax]
MSTLYTNTGRHYPPGTTVEESDGDGDDYENMAPPYKDLPPKPDSTAPPRPPRAGKKSETPPLPSKPPRMTALDLPPVPRKSHQLGVDREPPPVLPSQTTTPVPWLHPKSKSPGCHQEERLKVYLCLLLLVTSLILSCLKVGGGAREDLGSGWTLPHRPGGADGLAAPQDPHTQPQPQPHLPLPAAVLAHQT